MDRERYETGQQLVELGEGQSPDGQLRPVRAKVYGGAQFRIECPGDDLDGRAVRVERRLLVRILRSSSLSASSQRGLFGSAVAPGLLTEIWNDVPRAFVALIPRG